jgi:two-component sensor histidine kinase/ligand-binding sensor domain-containing protein/PAS domain-containing protein
MDYNILVKWSNLGCEKINKVIRWLKNIFLTLNIFILIPLTFPGNAYAQESTTQFHHIIAAQGLSQSSIYCILQDHEGFMWFGTQDGLNKYDGYNFTVYTYNEFDPKSLSDNLITTIYEDKSGIIWVGTDSGGLNKFNRETESFTHYTHNSNQPDTLGANRVLSIYEDEPGTLWIGTDGGGLNKFNPKTEQFTHYTHNTDDLGSLNNDTVLAIYEDSLGSLWIGTDGGGLNKFNPETGHFTHYTHDLTNPHSLSSNTVLSIYEDQTGKLWFGTNGGGLNEFNRQTENFTHYLPNPEHPDSLNHNTVSAIAEDHFGNLWLGTTSWYVHSYGTALDKFDPKTKQFTHYIHDPANPNSLSDNIVGFVFKDNSGILWVGTGFGGVNKLDLKSPKFEHYHHNPSNPNNLSDNRIMSIYEDQEGVVWIGTVNGGLDKFEPQTGKFTHYRHDSNNPNSLISDNVWSIYEDSAGMLWIGTFGSGLDKFDRKKGIFTHFQHNPNHPSSLSENTVTSIYEDNSGTLWIGTFGGGLNKFNKKTEQFSQYTHQLDNPNSLSDNSITLIYEDKSGTLWIGTFAGGLNRFDSKTGHFKPYKNDPNNSNSLSYDRIISIYEYPSGTLWIGTLGGGLDKFDVATETFKHYTERDGLPNNAVIGILGDDAGNLWISTDKGLSKFNPKTETFRNYDVGDGLQGNEFNGVKAYLKTKDGQMFFGGLNGFNTFYPDQVKDNPHIPPIVITNFQKFNKDVKLDTAISSTKEIKLSYKDNFFSFEFAALDYTNPSKNQYAYKLEGFDKDWIYSGTRRYASYTNLDGGTYTFRVKGSNNDGIWNEEGTSIKIIITPPPWKTWWAYMLYIIALISGVYGYVQWKTKAQAKENALLRENEQKLHQFLEAMPVGVGVIDTDSQLIYINQTALQIHGMNSTIQAPIEQLSEAYQVYISGTSQLYPTENLPLVRALNGEKTTLDNVEIHRPDKIIPLEVWGTPIYDEQGNIIYALAAFQDITYRKQAEAKLLKSLREKELLLQEVHHRVKNNLQVICSLLDLQFQMLNDPKLREVLQESYNRIRSMALVHEKLYESTSLEEINFKDCIESLICFLIQSYGTNLDLIQLNLRIAPAFLSIDTAIPCALIINELVSNSLKYAFPNQSSGLIEVVFKAESNHQYTLRVKDNGVGFPQSLNFETTQSLGLQLIKILTQQLEAELNLDQSQGIEFQFQFVDVYQETRTHALSKT